MKKFNILLSVVTVLVVTAVASGCMVISETAIFKASSKVDMPDISGAFTDPKHGTFILTRNEGASNSFSLTSPDKETMTLIFEPLGASDRYIVQAANPAGPEVLLGICRIADQTIEFYALKPPTLAPLTKKHNITINDNGLITNKPTAKRLKDFFNDCFDPKYSEKATTIQPGSSKDMKKSGKSSRGKSSSGAK